MATTGQDLKKEFYQAIDKAYSNYLDIAKLNTLFFRTFINLAEIKYRSLNTQKEYDEITSLIRSDKVYELNNNRIYTKPQQISSFTFTPTTATIKTVFAHNVIVGDIVTFDNVSGITGLSVSYPVASIVNTNTFTITAAGLAGTYTPLSGTFTTPKMIPDYTHLLTVRCRFVDQVKFKDVRVVNATNGSRLIVQLNKRTNLRNSDQITIQGVIGNTAANGTFFVSILSDFKVQLFNDENLLSPVTGNGDYIEGGVIKKMAYNYATQITPFEKISFFSTPTIDFPAFEISDNFIKFSPTNLLCDEITIDYASIDTETPIVRIDLNDNILNLENFYPKKFLVRLVEEAALLFNKDARDLQQYQAQRAEIIDNP